MGALDIIGDRRLKGIYQGCRTHFQEACIFFAVRFKRSHASVGSEHDTYFTRDRPFYFSNIPTNSINSHTRIRFGGGGVSKFPTGAARESNHTGTTHDRLMWHRNAKLEQAGRFTEIRSCIRHRFTTRENPTRGDGCLKKATARQKSVRTHFSPKEFGNTQKARNGCNNTLDYCSVTRHSPQPPTTTTHTF